MAGLGCQKKASGSVRCWCGGSDDCNDAENSRGLYETHIGPLSHKKTELASNRSRSLSVIFTLLLVVTTTKATTTTAATTTTTRRPTTKKATPRVHIHTTRRTPATSTTTETTTSTTTTPITPKATTAEKIFHEVNVSVDTDESEGNLQARPLPTDDRDKYDEIFDATRKALEAQMKEEDERLQQMLMDEEDEMDEDEEPAEEEKAPVVTIPLADDKIKHERLEGFIVWIRGNLGERGHEWRREKD